MVSFFKYWGLNSDKTYSNMIFKLINILYKLNKCCNIYLWSIVRLMITIFKKIDLKDNS